MATSSVARAEPTPSATPSRALAVLLLAATTSALFYYKWGGSLRAYDRAHHTGGLGIEPGILLHASVWQATAAYFVRIWPALTYGILIGAVVRAAVPPSWVARALSARGFRGSLAGGLTGAPLMLCSCCVTPVFTGLYERGARLSSSLAVMLGAPGLNVAALVLSFALLPPKLASARVLGALLIVLGVPPLLARLEPSETKGGSVAAAPDPTTLRDFAQRFARSVVYLALVTVPLIAVGVVMSGVVLPLVTRPSGPAGVALIALVATLAALPTFFEIAIALLMVHLGAPEAAVAAVLIAGPAVNLPSLLVLARETSPRLAIALGGAVWIVAITAGAAVSLS